MAECHVIGSWQQHQQHSGGSTAAATRTQPRPTPPPTGDFSSIRMFFIRMQPSNAFECSSPFSIPRGSPRLNVPFEWKRYRFRLWNRYFECVPRFEWLSRNGNMNGCHSWAFPFVGPVDSASASTGGRLLLGLHPGTPT